MRLTHEAAATQQWSVTISLYHQSYSRPYGLVYGSDGLTAFVSIMENDEQISTTNTM